MKRLVLCFDGTWNAVVNPKTVTNVVRLANLVAVSDENGINQITYYNSGVGSGGRIDRFLGGWMMRKAGGGCRAWSPSGRSRMLGSSPRHPSTRMSSPR